MPYSLLNKKIEVLESKKGIDGVTALKGDVFYEQDLKNKIWRRGWIIIDNVIEYQSKMDFEGDEKKHLVSSDSGYGWKDGKTKVIYGWKIKEFCLYDANVMHENYRIVRRLRSLFEIQQVSSFQRCKDANLFYKEIGHLLIVFISYHIQKDMRWNNVLLSMWVVFRVMWHITLWSHMYALNKLADVCSINCSLLVILLCFCDVERV